MGRCDFSHNALFAFPSVDDLLYAPIEPEPKVPKHNFQYDWETCTYLCYKCGKTIGDYQFDSEPCR